MKRIAFYLVLILSLCAAHHQSKGQSSDSLGVILISPIYPQCPDTVIVGQQSINMVVRIYNYNTINDYVGQLYVKFDASDTAAQIFLARDSFLLNSGALVTIPAHDSVAFLIPDTITFDTTHYRLGSNVVIVWPATSNNQLKFNPYSTCVNMLTTLGINDFDNLSSTFVVGPNPASSKIRLLSDIQKITESVRIYDATGRIVYNEKMKGNTIPVEFLNPGTYILEIITRNNQRLRKQFLKE